MRGPQSDSDPIAWESFSRNLFTTWKIYKDRAQSISSLTTAAKEPRMFEQEGAEVAEMSTNVGLLVVRHGSQFTLCGLCELLFNPVWLSIRAGCAPLRCELLRRALSPQTPATGSAYGLMLGGIGSIRSGVKDLASNPKHLEGFGRSWLE